jgi:uncharacterized protein (UPF0276 family)
MQHRYTDIPLLGFGLGLRQPHFEKVLRERPAVDWFEVISENFMDAHPGHREFLQDIRRQYPLVLHGVGLGIGNSDALDDNYLAKLASLAEAVQPATISDHLCWTGIHGIHSHDLLPVPYTREALTHITARVKQVQDRLGHRIALENPSSYAEFTASQMSECEFLVTLAEQADCALLLDVNNIYVNARNHGFEAKSYVDAIPGGRIAYTHLAGHRDMGTHIIDTHDDHIAPAVWELYRYATARHGLQNTLVEWDGNIPGFDMLMAELAKAKSVAESAVMKGAS